jgi:hypothetical protein
MTASRDPDRLIHGFLMEGDEQLRDQVFDEVRAQIEHKTQRVFIGPWRISTMNRSLAIGAAAVAVLVVVVIGSQVFGSPTNFGGRGAATPTPQPTATATQATPDTLASGSFAASLGEFGEAFDIEATKTGDDVSGTLDVSTAESAYSVDLQCARTTDVDQLIIAGEVRESTSEFIVEGVYVAIMLAPGTPAGMFWWADVLPSDEVPSPADSCSGFLDTIFSDPGLSEIERVLTPIEGDLELGQ